MRMAATSAVCARSRPAPPSYIPQYGEEPATVWAVAGTRATTLQRPNRFASHTLSLDVLCTSPCACRRRLPFGVPLCGKIKRQAGRKSGSIEKSTAAWSGTGVRLFVFLSTASMPKTTHTYSILTRPLAHFYPHTHQPPP